MRKVLLLIALFTPYVLAEESAQLIVDAKIYKLDKTNSSIGLKNLLADSTLERNPRLLSEYGKEVSLRLDYEKENGSEGSALEIIVQSDEVSKTYDIDINILNGDKKNISRIDSHPIGQTFIASTIIENASRVIQIDVLESNPALATFVLQVSSNLGCDSLAIELASHGQQYFLEFTKGAFASVALPKGDYSFGNVVCTKEDELLSLDLLKDKLMPLAVESGRTYYGGRLIFQQDEQVSNNARINQLENCTRMVSGARGEKQDNLCASEGIESVSTNTTQVEVFMPTVTDQDLDLVEGAFSTGRNNVTYIPLKIKN